MNVNRDISGQPRSSVRNLRSAMALVVMACGFTLSAASQACTSADPGNTIYVNGDSFNEYFPDRIITSRGGEVSFYGCPQDAMPMEVTASFSGINYVKNVTLDASGNTYPAFAADPGPSSPLLVFFIESMTQQSGGSVTYPFDPRQVLQIEGLADSGNVKRIRLQIYMLSRGGLMTSVPFTALGTVTVASPQYPSISTTFTVQVEAAFQEKTCVITDPPTVLLGDIRRQDLPTIGSTAADQDFDVEFSCNGPNFRLRMILADANDPGNTSSRLAPSRNSTAQGVRIELLRGTSLPVSFGQAWNQGSSTGSDQSVTFTARYHREASTFSAGTIGGQATLVLDYK